MIINRSSVVKTGEEVFFYHLIIEKDINTVCRAKGSFTDIGRCLVWTRSTIATLVHCTILYSISTRGHCFYWNIILLIWFYEFMIFILWQENGWNLFVRFTFILCFELLLADFKIWKNPSSFTVGYNEI